MAQEENIEFPFEFEMALPEFGTQQASIESHVFYLDELITSNSNAVVLKNYSESELIQLFVSSPVVDTGVVSTGEGHVVSDPGLVGYHFYSFPNEVTVYAEQALQIIPLA